MQQERLIKLLEMESQNPGDPFYRYALGMEYLGLGDVKTAEMKFRECLEIDSSEVPAYYQLALLVREDGREEEALQLLEAGLLLLKDSGKTKAINEFGSLADEIRY